MNEPKPPASNSSQKKTNPTTSPSPVPRRSILKDRLMQLDKLGKLTPKGKAVLAKAPK
jgi:hypothetical protein